MRITMRWLAPALAALTFLAVPGVRGDDAAKVTGDLKKMQGTWVRAGDEGPELKWVIDGDSLKADVDGMMFTCTITVDSKATPNTLDLKVSEGPGDAAGKVSKAIYKFDGETLLVCGTHPGGENRPTEFKTAEGAVFLFKLKKEK